MTDFITRFINRIHNEDMQRYNSAVKGMNDRLEKMEAETGGYNMVYADEMSDSLDAKDMLKRHAEYNDRFNFTKFRDIPTEIMDDDSFKFVKAKPEPLVKKGETVLIRSELDSDSEENWYERECYEDYIGTGPIKTKTPPDLKLDDLYFEWANWKPI